MLRAISVALCGSFVISSGSFGEEQLRVGMVAPASRVAEFVSGSWKEVHGSACPVLLHRDSPKIAIYAKKANKPLLRLASAIGEIVAGNPALKWSFLFVSHENAPTPTDDQWDAQLKELKQLANDNNIKQLSLGIMMRIPEEGPEPGRVARKLGFFGDGDVVVMLIDPDTTRKRGVVRYVNVLKTDQIDKNVIERVARELKDAIASSGS